MQGDIFKNIKKRTMIINQTIPFMKQITHDYKYSGDPLAAEMRPPRENKNKSLSVGALPTSTKKKYQNLSLLFPFLSLSGSHSFSFPSKLNQQKKTSFSSSSTLCSLSFFSLLLTITAPPLFFLPPLSLRSSFYLFLTKKERHA